MMSRLAILPLALALSLIGVAFATSIYDSAPCEKMVNATIDAYTDFSHDTRAVAEMGFIVGIILVALYAYLAYKEVYFGDSQNAHKKILNKINKITNEWFNLLKWLLIISGIFLAADISSNLFVLIIGFISIFVFINYIVSHLYFWLDKPFEHLLGVDQEISIDNKVSIQKKIATILSIIIPAIITALIFILLIGFMPELLNDIIRR